jgi:hypothetical protein
VFPLPTVLEPLHGVHVAAPAPAAGGPRAKHHDQSPAFPRPCPVFPPPAPTKTTPGRKSVFPVTSLLVTSLSSPILHVVVLLELLRIEAQKDDPREKEMGREQDCRRKMGMRSSALPLSRHE